MHRRTQLGGGKHRGRYIVQAVSFIPLRLGPVHHRHSRLHPWALPHALLLPPQNFFVSLNLLVAICKFDQLPKPFPDLQLCSVPSFLFR